MTILQSAIVGGKSYTHIDSEYTHDVPTSPNVYFTVQYNIVQGITLYTLWRKKSANRWKPQSSLVPSKKPTLSSVTATAVLEVAIKV